MFKVLSLDGGGIKGTFTASVLAGLERMTGKRVIEHFDLITGTSTGGIIALGLGLGMSAAEILDFYETHGPKIFPTIGLQHRLRWFRRLLHPKPSQSSLNAALVQVFGNKSLGQSCCRLVIPSYNCVSGEIYLFKTAHHDRYKQDYLTSAVDVAMATSAAPIYFPAHQGQGRGSFVDGGVWANCPAMIGVIESIFVLKSSPSEVRVLSIGTTDEPFYVTKKRRNGGLFYWNIGLIDLFMQAQVDAALGQVRVSTGNDPYRISSTVTPGRFSLDNAKALDDLVALGHTEARKHETNVSRLFLSEKCAPFEPCLRAENGC